MKIVVLVLLKDLQSWTKVLGHFCVSGAFSNSHRANPSPHPINNGGRVYSELFPSFSFVYGGGRENCKKISKRMPRGNQEMTEKYDYCSTVPRTFVRDCRMQSGKAQDQNKADLPLRE